LPLLTRRRRFQDGSFWQDPRLDESPERDQQLASKGHNPQPLLLDSRVLADQQLNKRTKQRFASLSHVVNELEEPEVEGEFFL
jgi:hypothetical protein